jgi:ribosomal protein S18 acetylase RimI-like enzyme
MDHNPSQLVLRRLLHDDLLAALVIQSANYPAFLREGAAAFASRLDLPASYCLAATLDGALVGYLLAHGWPSESPPEIGALLAPDLRNEVLFIHDLAVGSAGRGLGLGRKLVERAFELAAGDGLQAAELIAVEGAAGYWRSLGFAEANAAETLSSKVAAYGDEARWMRRRIATGEPIA